MVAEVQLPEGGIDRLAEREQVFEFLLRVLRENLGMEVAYLSRIVDQVAEFRYVSAPGFEGVCRPGMSMNLGEMYCGYVLKEQLPNLIADTADYQLAQELPVTKQVPIGCHISVPVTLANGEFFGTLCLLGREPSPSLSEADLASAKTLARIMARYLG